GVKGSYKGAIEAVEEYIASFENIRIHKLREMYPAGDEIVLIYQTTGRRPQPGALPISVGVTVFNVETVYNVYLALNGSPVTHKYVTVAGEVKNPVTLRVPLGTTVKELVALAGGATVEDPAYLFGGPMMGRLGPATAPVTKTFNAVIVLPSDHVIVQRKNTKTSIDMKRAMAACCQCSYCTDLCPRHLLGYPINPAEFMRVVSNYTPSDTKPIIDGLFCSGCGLCEAYSCGQGLSPRMLLDAFKGKLRAAGVQPPKDIPLRDVSPAIDFRSVPVARLAARLGLTKYNKTAPMDEEREISPRIVKIMLSQHIGVPAVPCVKKGSTVLEGQLIASAADGKLSVNIHSSVKGYVKEITDKFIMIEQ
ncbi:MAG: SLBB domain-containing protein, partial [Clostridia bacterium]|nr:SLBB domain-containing protein [Clostridia bacterium]